MRRKIPILMVLLLLLSAQCCFAADETNIKPINITGSHRIEDNTTLKTGRHTFVLTGLNGAPMPDGSTDNVKKVTISSGEDFSFGDINIPKAGIYEYTITRETSKSKALKEDNSEYHAKVAVFYDGSNVLIYEKKGINGKKEKIEYVDQYTGSSSDKDSNKAKTGDTSAIIIYSIIFATAALLLIAGLRRKNDDENL